MKRIGMVSQVRPGKLDRYIKLHRAVWPGVLEQIEASNIRNYTIFLKRLPDGEHYLFSYFEYVGDDFDGDMASMAAHEETQRWWAECKPLLKPADTSFPTDEVWVPMEDIFHTQGKTDDG